MARVTREIYKCDRCGHEWMPRGTGKPIVCPKCKSPYWDRPKRIGLIIKSQKKRS